MKKRILTLVLLLVLAIGLTGCAKKDEDKKKKDTKKTEWKLVTDGSTTISKKALTAFNSATKKFTGSKLEPIALLGTQVVSGKNYVFLVRSTTTTEKAETSLKVVIVYNSLKDKASIKSITDFDINKYVDKKIENEAKEADGAITAVTKVNDAVIEEKALASFNKATETLTGATYTPISLIATSDKGYSFITLGNTATAEANYSINVVTIEKDKVKTIAYVDLADFNE